MTTIHELLEVCPKIFVLEFLASYGGQRVHVPTLAVWLRLERDVSILIQRSEGLSYEALAERHGLSQRQIRRIVEPHKAA